MKKHGLLKTLGIMLLLIIVITYFVPGRQDAISYIGLADAPVNYFSIVLSNFSYIFLYVLVIGGFYSVLNKIPAYKKMLDSIVTRVKPIGRKFIFLIIIIFAVAASLTGMNIQLLVFVPLVASIIILLGYDKLVAVSSTIVSILIGYLGGIFTTILNPNTYGITTFEEFIGLDNKFANTFPKLLLLLTGIALLIYFVNKHISDVEGKKVKYELNDNSELLISEVKGNYKNIKVWPLVTTLVLMFVIMVLGLIPWASLYDISFFSDFHTTITGLTVGALIVRLILVIVAFGLIQLVTYIVSLIKKTKFKFNVTIPVIASVAIVLVLEILSVSKAWNIYDISFMKSIVDFFKGNNFYDFAFVSNIISDSLPALGEWNVNGNPWYNYIIVSVLALFVALVLAIVNKVKADEAVDSFIEGCKKALPAALLMTIAYTVLVCAYNNGFLELLISKYGKFNFGVSSLLAFLGCLLNVDSYYIVAGCFSPILTLVTDESIYEALAILFQGIYAIFSVVGPTSIILVFALTYFDIPYTTWLKYIWRFVLGLILLLALVVCLVVLL